MPGDAIRITVGLGPAAPESQVTLYYTTDGSAPEGTHGVATNGSAMPLRRVEVSWDYLLWGYRERWEGEIPPQLDGTRVRYSVEAWSDLPGGGPSLWAGGETPRVFGFNVDRLPVPVWLRECVIYQIFVDRFAPDPGPTSRPRRMCWAASTAARYGASSRAWITSHTSGSIASGSRPSSPARATTATTRLTIRRSNRGFGTLQDLDDLIQAAHGRGIRVILDFVANHLSAQHPAFLAALADRASPTFDWFTFDDWPDDYATFFGVRSMPKINTDDPGARAWLIDSARDWVVARYRRFPAGPRLWRDPQLLVRLPRGDARG